MNESQSAAAAVGRSVVRWARWLVSLLVIRGAAAAAASLIKFLLRRKRGDIGRRSRSQLFMHVARRPRRAVRLRRSSEIKRSEVLDRQSNLQHGLSRLRMLHLLSTSPIYHSFRRAGGELVFV